MKKALIITRTNYSDEELIYAYYRLLEDGFKVDIASDVISTPANKKPLKGVNGISMHSDMLSTSISADTVNHYDLLILPGGVKAMEKLRQEENVIAFIHLWNSCDKVIGSICWAAQLLISAKVVAGRAISGYYSIKDDIENAGAIYLSLPAVQDDNIVSTAHYKDLASWMRLILNVYYARN